jgi:UDP:flavonoid glycosyltransferase YjiC (YdhE family)
MRILFTTNPLYGHLYPMLPLMNAARQADHEVIVATGPDFAREVQRHGFQVWTVGPPAPPMRIQSAAPDEDPPMDELQQMVEAGTRLFGRPGIARTRDLIPQLAKWQPDVVVHELLETAGWQAAAVTGALDVIHGFGTHIPYLIEAMQIVLSSVRSELGRSDRSVDPTEVPYVDPCPPLLQPPGGTPFRNVLPLRPEMGVVHPGEQLPQAMRDLLYDKTIYLTFGTAFNMPPLLMQAVDAVRELRHNVIVTTGPGVDPAIFTPLPAQIAIAPFVPQALIMKNCAAVVPTPAQAPCWALWPRDCRRSAYRWEPTSSPTRHKSPVLEPASSYRPMPGRHKLSEPQLRKSSTIPRTPPEPGCCRQTLPRCHPRKTC